MSSLREEVQKISKRLERLICCFNQNTSTSINLSNSDLQQTEGVREYNMSVEEDSYGELKFKGGLVKFVGSYIDEEYGEVSAFSMYDFATTNWVNVVSKNDGISIENVTTGYKIFINNQGFVYYNSSEDVSYTFNVPVIEENQTVNYPKGSGTIVLKVNGVAANESGNVTLPVGDAAQFIVNTGGYIEPKPAMGGTGLKVKGFSPSIRAIEFGAGSSPVLTYEDCTVILYGVNADTITMPLMDINSPDRQQILNLYFHTDTSGTPLVMSFSEPIHLFDHTTSTIESVAGIDVSKYAIQGVPLMLQNIEDEWYVLNPIDIL
jgi:hypothetical protein